MLAFSWDPKARVGQPLVRVRLCGRFLLLQRASADQRHARAGAGAGRGFDPVTTTATLNVKEKR
jgi:hypothetical protein